MRLFIAIEIPEYIKDYMGEIQEKIADDLAKIRFVNKKQIHLTLKFLGEVQPNNIKDIKEKLKKIKFTSFSVYLNSIGVFPNEDYIRIVWIDLKPENEILEMQKNIDENLKKLFKKEKNFKVHVTLARVKFIDNDRLFDFYPEVPESRRQDLEPPAFVRNGSIYATTRKSLLETKLRLGKDTRPYIMPESRTINIDEVIDLKLAELLLNERSL